MPHLRLRILTYYLVHLAACEGRVRPMSFCARESEHGTCRMKVPQGAVVPAAAMQVCLEALEGDLLASPRLKN